MSKRHAIVEVNGGRLEVSLLRGRGVARSAAAPVQLGSESWGKDLLQTAATLKRLVSEAGAEDAEATVLYAGPTSVNGVFSCAKAAGQAQAHNAARLALAESSDFPLESNPHTLVQLATDKASAAGAAPQVHMLGVAENEQTAQTIVQWLQEAGLTARALVPMDAPAIAAAARHVLGASDQGAAAALFVGEYGSVFAGASGGRLKFLRQIAIGTESLVLALAREVRPRESADPITLDPETARTLLFRAGIPAREQAFDAERGIQGDAVLPLLQPVLQRWLVEIKQSMRFGFDDAERASATLLPMGNGAAIPRLHEIVAQQCGLKLSDRSEELSHSAAEAWRAGPIAGLNLLPLSVMGKKESFKLTRGMWVGVAAACALIAADATLTRMDLKRARTENAELQTRLDAALPGAQMKERLIAIRTGVAAANARMRSRMTPCVNWDAVLGALARETPERVRLNDVRLGIESGSLFCRISGDTPLEHSSDVLKAYSDKLASLPIVSTYRMGATQRGSTVLGPVQQFEMTLGLVDLPPGAAAPLRLTDVPVEETNP